MPYLRSITSKEELELLERKEKFLELVRETAEAQGLPRYPKGDVRELGPEGFPVKERTRNTIDPPRHKQ